MGHPGLFWLIFVLFNNIFNRKILDFSGIWTHWPPAWPFDSLRYIQCKTDSFTAYDCTRYLILYYSARVDETMFFFLIPLLLELDVRKLDWITSPFRRYKKVKTGAYRGRDPLGTCTAFCTKNNIYFDSLVDAKPTRAPTRPQTNRTNQ